MFNRSPPLFLFYSGNLPKGAEGSSLSKKSQEQDALTFFRGKDTTFL